MQPFDGAYERVRKAFQLVRQEREKTSVSDKWQMDVMRDIRKLGASNPENSSFAVLERFFWRFSVTGQLTVMVLLVYMFQLLCANLFQANANLEYRMAQAFLEDPAAVVLPFPMGND